MTAEFDGNPKTTVILVYAPTICADEVEVKEFYNDLRDTLQDVPAHNFLACIGDFNARLGPDEVPFTYHDVTNRNGKYLVELLSEYSLIQSNTEYSLTLSLRSDQENCGPSWVAQDRCGNSITY